MLVKKRLSNSTVELSADRRLSFYAALYDAPTEISEPGTRPFTEVVGHHAFDDFLRTQGEVIGNINHDASLSFAKRSDGTLLLQSDAKGLFASAYLPDNEIGNAIMRAYAEGRVVGTSFQFRPIIDRTLGNGTVERTKVVLEDVCVAIGMEPAYPQTADEVFIRTKKADNTALLQRLKFQKWKLLH